MADYTKENDCGFMVPLFAGSSTTNKRGRRTYPGPRESSNTATKSRRHHSHARISSSSSSSSSSKTKKKSSRNRGSDQDRDIGSSSIQSRTRKSNASSRGMKNATSALKRGGPVEVSRCALQTLGGSTTRGPLKEGLAMTQSSKATLKKMESYGGKMFYDKCYLSDEGETGGEKEETRPWALSPLGGFDEDGDGPVYAAGVAKKKAKAAPSSPSSHKRPLQLSSNLRKHDSDRTTSDRASSSNRKSGGNRRSVGKHDPFSLGDTSASEEGEESDGCSEGSSDGDFDREVQGNDDDDPSKPRSRGAATEFSPAPKRTKKKAAAVARGVTGRVTADRRAASRSLISGKRGNARKSEAILSHYHAPVHRPVARALEKTS